MRQADSDDLSFGPAAFIVPASDMSSDTSTSDLAEYAIAAATPIADGPSPVAASSDNSADGGGGVHVLTDDGSFWFDANDGAVNDQAAVVIDAGSATEGLGPASEVAASDGDAAFTFVSANLVQDSAPSIIAAETSDAPFSHTGFVNGDTSPTAAIANTALVFNDPGPSAGPSSAASNAPILAWIGDTGAGTSNGASSGSGSGSGGTAVHTTGASSGLVINVVYDSSVNSAPAGFTAAVAQVVSFYESHFSNPVTITIDVGYGEIDGQSLGSNALGESETYLTSVSYAQLQSDLVKSANAVGDTAAAASLPAASPVSGQYWLSTAEAKALGITGASTSVDGFAGFSSSVNFAYNDSSGVAANQYDFFGVVAHEFSEIMGRQMMDGESFAGGSSYEPLDLFHYSAAGVRDFSGTTAGYASANGGTTSLDSFNTNPGGDFGDWAASAGNDSFLAFTGTGAVNSVTAADVTLMNLLGWDSAASTGQPPAPTPTPVVTLYLAHDTGVSSTDGITSNDALTGTADANAVVKFTSGTHSLGTTTANASGVWSFTPAGLADGQYTIVASETNSAGITGSASLAFTLDTTAPAVTSDAVSGAGISAGTGMLTVGQTAVLTLALSEAVILSGGVPTLSLNDGGTATYDAAHSTAKSLVFDYTVAAGQYATALAVTEINLHGTTVTDAAGNAANFTAADTTFSHLLVDATTPLAAADHAHDALKGAVSASHAQGVLANDSDSDPADALSVSAVNGSAGNVGHSVTGAYGNLALNSDGSYSYTNSNSTAVTAAGGVAEDIFSYTVSNGHGGMTNSTLTFLITSPGETYIAGAAGSTIKGGSGGTVLDGSAGNVNAMAGSGAQWLVGGSGDTLTAGSAADTFIFAPSFGKETINNFNTAQDTIDLPQSLFASFAAVQADLHASGANAVLTLDANDAITLSHVAVANLHAQNFHFVV